MYSIQPNKSHAIDPGQATALLPVPPALDFGRIAAVLGEALEVRQGNSLW